eukprot:scaffold2400_cov187-Cylindrotheca_fusiformis.AAC.10
MTSQDHAGLGNSGWASPARDASASPAGFNNGVAYENEDVRAQAEALRCAGSLSAPPPGFDPNSEKSGAPEQIWNDKGSSNPMDGGRTSSFTNLAAALGSGLAESINDAVLTDSFFAQNPKGDLNYARQSRHAASRLVGSSEAFYPSHKTSDAGPLFASFDARDRPQLKNKGGYLEDNSRNRGQTPGGLYGSGSFSSAFSKDSGSQPSYQTKSPALNYGMSASKDLGMTVTEPTDSYRGQQDNGLLDIQRSMQNLWSNENTESSPMSGGSTVVDSAEIQRQAEDDLRPFTWDVRHHEASRALAIVRAASLPAADIRCICENYGVLESFRSDFVDRGVYFVSYYDIRCAQYAAMELQLKLQQFGPAGSMALVQFCVPLNSSSQNDESLVLLNDVPMDMNIDSLGQMMSSYGAVRSLKSLGGSYGGASFVAEYHDIQDAKQAVLELESTQPWGPNVSVETGGRNPSDRKRGRELLSLIGRWRHGGVPSQHQRRHPASNVGAPRSLYNPGSHTPPRPDPRYDRGGLPQETTQVVVGPDGKYHSYVVVNHSGYPPSYGGYHGDHMGHSNQGPYVSHHVNPSSNRYWSPQSSQQHHFSGGGSVVSGSSAYSDGHYSGHYPSGSRSVPYYPDGGSTGSHHSHIKSVPEGVTKNRDDTDNRHLRLDVDSVESGRDSRTSLMVRNIPNKYTQQMLLSEFAENGHGPGVIDFFYLPIDFKNKCNRGYAFINFVDYRDILPFHRRYFGKHWRTFNSDKICEITYARIQGKSAMLKRFENSALMEKDEEYKPLVFVSNGPDKGTRLPFPDPTNRA